VDARIRKLVAKLEKVEKEREKEQQRRKEEKAREKESKQQEKKDKDRSNATAKTMYFSLTSHGFGLFFLRCVTTADRLCRLRSP
jgi:septal ring factor EnvC (AmiA/AmiB activator)